MIGKLCTNFNILGYGYSSGHVSSKSSGHNTTGRAVYVPNHCPIRTSPGSRSRVLSGGVAPLHARAVHVPIHCPIIKSPVSRSRIHSGAVTRLHARGGGGDQECMVGWLDEGKQQSRHLPLPPLAIPDASLCSSYNSVTTPPSLQQSAGRVENLSSPGSGWKKGKLLGSGAYGHVYIGFNSESGQMCAMKEVALISDDSKSKESERQLAQEISTLSSLRHPNIVQYYGSEKVDDRLFTYMEYVSGGSISNLLKEFGELGEPAICSYTRQILSGLAYLHAKNIVHRDIKGPNILVAPDGRVKLADFGASKHVTGEVCSLSFRGSPYWMAPEVITNESGCNLAVDIWSLGCTVLEMATSKPPWSQYGRVAAIFKIGNSEELPEIPEHLSDDAKDFIRKCLQRNPFQRPAAANLLQHPFVNNALLL